MMYEAPYTNHSNITSLFRFYYIYSIPFFLFLSFYLLKCFKGNGKYMITSYILKSYITKKYVDFLI